MRFGVPNFVFTTDRFRFVPQSKLSWRFFENNLMLTNWQPHWYIYLFVAQNQTRKWDLESAQINNNLWWPIWQPSLLSSLTTRVASVKSELVSNRQEQSKKMIGLSLINKFKNHGQTSFWFCLAKGKKYMNQIHITTLINPCNNITKSRRKNICKGIFWMFKLKAVANICREPLEQSGESRWVWFHRSNIDATFLFWSLEFLL